MKTQKLVPKLPNGWNQSGYLYDSDNRASLGEEMFDAWLDDGTMMIAGWSEFGNPSAEYVVRVLKGQQDIGRPYRTGDIKLACAYIERMATDLVAKELLFSCTSTFSQSQEYVVSGSQDYVAESRAVVV
jgi:hypothetical protein